MVFYLLFGLSSEKLWSELAFPPGFARALAPVL